MKKLSLLLVAVLLFSFNAYAKVGDVIGQYYSTDIVTTLNGAGIDSINIGGRTLIYAENMAYYSFRVDWNSEARTLDISSVPFFTNGALPEISKKHDSVGKSLGNYYETDIVTYLDSKPITAYNVGGKTYILAEQMSDFGYIVVWDEEKRTLDISSLKRAGYEYGITLTKAVPTLEEGVGKFSIDYTKGSISLTDDADHFHSSFISNGKGYIVRMAFYQNEALFSSSCLIEKLNSFKYKDVTGYEVPVDEKYDIINKNVKIAINGIFADKISVFRYQGNGHVDFEFYIEGISAFKEDEIESIHFSII